MKILHRPPGAWHRVEKEEKKKKGGGEKGGLSCSSLPLPVLLHSRNPREWRRKKQKENRARACAKPEDTGTREKGKGRKGGKEEKGIVLSPQ